MADAWVQAVSGVAFDLLTPRAEDVKIDDVIHALARLSRYSGHTRGPRGYAVAEHSMLVANLLAAWGCPPAVCREGLLHDAPEAYYGDITSPVQRAIADLFHAAICDAVPAGPARDAALDRSPMRALHRRIDEVVRPALGLPIEETPIVKRADLVALAIERRDLMAPCERDWRLVEYAPPGIQVPSWRDRPYTWDSDMSETAMHARLREYDEQIAGHTDEARP